MVTVPIIKILSKVASEIEWNYIKIH